MIGTAPASAESAEGTVVTTVGPTITNAAGNVYSISPAGYVMTNGQPETTISANVIELAYHAPAAGGPRQLYQENSSGLWFTRTSVTAAYYQTSDPTMQTLNPVIVTPTPAAGPGPTASSSFLTVDFASTTGVFAPRHLWGLASAAPQNDHFALWNNASFVTAMATIRPPVFRLNSNSGQGNTGVSETGYWSDDIFASGINSPNWNVIAPFLANAYKFMDADTRIIVGVRLTGRSFSDYASICSQIGTHLLNTSGGNGVPVPIYGFEVGNEEDSHVSDADYCSYFNAAATALHAINSNWRMFGTVDSYMTTTAPDGRFVTFANSCGDNANVVLDYHGYSYGKQNGVNSRTNSQLFTTEPADNGSVARQSVAGTSLANAEIFMGEWNMDFNAADEVRQQQPIGACFAAYWMASGFKAHHNVTMGAMWETYGDGDYGAIQGSGTIVPSGRLLQKAAAVMGGNEVNSTFNTGNALCLPIANGNHIGVMIVNWNTGSISGQVALSHWPINTSGTASITQWEIDDANPQGTPTTITVTNGMTPTITLPAFSVIVLHN